MNCTCKLDGTAKSPARPASMWPMPARGPTSPGAFTRFATAGFRSRRVVEVNFFGRYRGQAIRQSSDQVIAVIGNGEMGSAVAQVLVRAGARVLTSLRGRGEASRARAQAAGAHAIDDDWELVSQADVMLSVVPPGQARAVAERFVGPLRRKAHRPCMPIAMRLHPPAPVRSASW